MVHSSMFVLVFQITIWWCVGGTSPWRLPHGLSSPSPNQNLQKTAAFQLSKDFYRDRLARNNTPSRVMPSPLPAASVPVINRPTASLIGNGSSNSYKNFYRVFYGAQEGSLSQLPKKLIPEISRETSREFSTPSKPIYNGRVLFGNSQVASQELEDVRKASDHFLRVRTEAKCSLPKPRVVRVKDYYPNPSKDYLPRCTILHRCGDDTSCCDSDAFECVATRIQEVVLHFYTLHASKSNSSVNLPNAVETLLFENHTSCECQPINDLPRVNPGPSDLIGTRAGSQVVASTTQTTSTTTSTTTIAPTSSTSEPKPAALFRESIPNHLHQSKCRECPVPFSRRDFSDGRCSCDCFDRHKPCLKIKRGRDPLNEVERRCVEVSHCHIPECEYGSYDYDTGKCPKKPENYRKIPDSKEYMNHHHRWNFFERD